MNAQNEGANGDQLLPNPVAAMHGEPALVPALRLVEGLAGMLGMAGAVQQPQLPPPSDELIEQLVGLTGSTRTAVLAVSPLRHCRGVCDLHADDRRYNDPETILMQLPTFC